MKQNKVKRSPKIRWKIFGFMLVPTLLMLLILWFTQTILLGAFYAGVKTDELKTTTENVIENIDKRDIHDRILYLSSNGNINIRVVDTAAFESLYNTGDAFDSVTFGLGVYGMFDIYEDAVKNDGELVRYYSENEDFDRFDYQDDGENDDGYSSNEAQSNPQNDFRDNFKRTSRPAFFDNIGKHNDLLYAKIARLSDGEEIMVIADTRISPLDSTVKTLKIQLVSCTVIIIVVALLLSLVIAKRVSKPIEKTTKGAKVLAGGNFDVTFEGKGYREIEELNETLNYASKELGKVEMLRRELMANVSHDMRTPLTMIVGYSEAMRDIPGENNPENVQVIIDEANRLTEFVNSVLDLSKLQGGLEHIEKTRLDITQLLIESVERYRKLMPEPMLCIDFEYSTHIEVEADRTKLVQVIHNLIDNAVNYSRDPKRVVIRQKTTDDNVRIEISDNGSGIKKEELPYIWDRYYRTDSSHKRNVVGAGIGLSIVKEILRLHSARYGVETEENTGSTFWFELKKMK